MESEEFKIEWPIIRQSDVADVCRNICGSIIDLESAFEAGEVSSRLTTSCIKQVLGPQLYAVYEKLANKTPGPLQHLRVNTVRVLLAQLRKDLQPTQVAYAKGHMQPGKASWAAEAGLDSSPRRRFKFVDASFDNASHTTLRFDQMLDARFWGIGFTFEALDLNDAFAQEVVRNATQRLASELNGLQLILERFTPKPLSRELRIVPDSQNRRFEHLMLDILNEDDRHANMAPIVEDFLEKTDLRVKYPGLKRRRGARVQVTSIVAPDLHKTKLGAIKSAEEFVFLSPLSLAEFVDSLQKHTPSSSKPGTTPFALSSLWNCLETKPINIPQLASALKQTMFCALAGTPTSPLGPLVNVPLPIRQLIRLFVETRAIASTSRLRDREKGVSTVTCYPETLSQ